MKLSIITVVLNREATIAQAIASVAMQQYDDVEHLIIDGNSQDGTLEEIRRHAHPGMRVLSEPDHGIYDALNKGIELASGDVIGIMHSDDFFAHDHVLSRVVKTFHINDADAVYGDLDYVAASNTVRVIRRWRSEAFNQQLLARGWMPPHPTLFVRRDKIMSLGLYDTSYQIAADYEAILRWFGRGGLKPIYIPEVLVKMRMGGASNSSIDRVVRKSSEDYRALRSSGVGGLGTLALKNLRKIRQFFS